MLIEISVNVHEMMKLNYVILFLGKGGMLQNISFWLRRWSHALIFHRIWSPFHIPYSCVLVLWSHARLETKARRALANDLEACVQCTLLLLLDSLLWEGTFVPTYWRTQGSKPLDRAFGPVQSFEYAAEHSNSFMFCLQKISFWEVQELEFCACRAQNFLRLKYLGHRNRKKGKSWEKKETENEIYFRRA